MLRIYIGVQGRFEIVTYWFAKDRQHVMTKYQSADGQQTYELKSQERVNYWTIKE